MALAAKGDEVHFAVISQKTSGTNVVDLESIGRPASLTSPTVALEEPN